MTPAPNYGSMGNVINGNGLSAVVNDSNYLSVFHQLGFNAGIQAVRDGGVTSAVFDFNFAAPATFDELLIWNYTQSGLTNRGINAYTVQVDTGSGLGGALTAVPGSINAAPYDAATHTAQAVNIGLQSNVQSLRLSASTNHGGNAIGLDEVLFRDSTNIVVPPITPISAIGTAPTFGSPLNLINGAGLSGTGDILARTHVSNHTTGWLKDNVNPANELVFTMPGTAGLTGLHAWQYEQAGCCGGRGVNTFDVSFSTDRGKTYGAPISLSLDSSAVVPGDETVQNRAFPLQTGVTHVKFTNMTDFPTLPNPGWQGLNEVRFEGTVSPTSLAGTPIGNALTPRAHDSDTSTQLLYSNFVPIPATGEVAGVSAYLQAGGNTFSVYQLRPTGTPNEYTVLYDSGAILPNGDAGGVQSFWFPNGPTNVQAGDVFAHYGRGIPWSLASETNGANPQPIFYPSPTAPAPGTAITLGTGGFPQYSQSRDYASAVDFVPVGITKGLMAYWNFDDAPAPGTFVYADKAVAFHSGDVDDSTFTGGGNPAHIPGKVGAGALDLNGGSAVYANFSQDIGRVSGPTNITTEMSVQAWVRFDSAADNQDVLAKRHTNNTSGWVLETRQGDLYWYLNNVPGAGGWNAVIGTDVPADHLDEWTHLVMTWRSGDKMRMYVNGEDPFESANPVGGSAFLWDDLLGFGAWGGIGRYFDGGLDEVAIWNRQLSPDEVRGLYNSGGGMPIEPVPEPVTLALTALGLASLGGYVRRRRRKA